MTKLPRHEMLHYSKQKGMNPLDTHLAISQMDEKELNWYHSQLPELKYIYDAGKTVIKKLLECQHAISQIQIRIDKVSYYLYKNMRPITTAKFFQNFYKDKKKNSCFEIWGIKRKSIVRDQNEDDEVYAMTDSDSDST